MRIPPVMFLVIVPLLMSSFTTAALAQQCQEVEPGTVILALPSTFNGIGSSLQNCGDFFSHIVCSITNNVAIIDGRTGPTAPNLTSVSDVQMFLTWQRQADFLIVFSLRQSVTIISIELYFLSYPTQRISLPNIQLFGTPHMSSLVTTGGSLMNYTFSEPFIPQENTINNVTLLVLSNPGPHASLHLRISFAGVDNIDWFFLSEVNICVGTPAPPSLPDIQFQSPSDGERVGLDTSSDTPTSVVLICTVSVAGVFQWQWKRNNAILPNGGRYQITVADGTSTGKLNISELRYTDAGNYTCEARHQSESSYQSRAVELVLVVVDTQEMVTGYIDEGEVVLMCEVYGYLRSNNPTVTWSRQTGNTRQLLQNTPPKYTVELSNGPRQALNPDGTTRQSIVAKLTIRQLANADAGTYVCEAVGEQEERTAEVKVMPGSAPTGQTPGTGGTPTTGGMPITGVTEVTTTMSGGPTDNSTFASVPVGGSNGGVIAAAVILTLLFIGVLAAIAIVLVVVFLRWHKMRPTKSDLRTQNGNGTTNHTAMTATTGSGSSPRKYTVNDIEWQIEPQLYSTVNKEEPPAIPVQNFDVTELYDMGYEDHRPPARRMTALSQYSYSGPPKLAKVSNSKMFSFSPNPIYQSREDLPNGSYENTPNELNIYAEPLKGGRLTPNAASRSGEPIYSEALDPSLLFSQGTGVSGKGDLHPYGAIYADPQPLKKSEAPIEITASNIRELKRLGIGQFGEVVLAETVGVSLKDIKMGHDDSKNIHIQVAVKKLKSKAGSSVRESFEKEIKFMSRLKDENIVCLLAICTSGSPFIVMEYMENGDLNQYLQKYELATSDSSVILPNQLPSSILVYMVVQIASGMRYLASLKYVHRDMATRNCLVGRDYVVKIADFGMSRSLYEDSYYRVRGRAMLPIRWMATESFYGRFSEKTDIWAYGVTMWEVFTFCKQQPYEEQDDQEVIQDAIRGTSRQLLPKPEGCSQEIYEVMLRCWEYVPDERADFDEIFSTLSAIHRCMY